MILDQAAIDYNDHWIKTGYSVIADREGWLICDTSMGTNQQPFEIQRDDEAALIETDWHAHHRVLRGAKDGLPHCLAALAFLETHAPLEHEAMLERDAEGFYDDYPYQP